MIELPSELVTGIFAALFTAVSTQFYLLKKQGNRLSQCLSDKAMFEERCRNLENHIQLLESRILKLEEYNQDLNNEIKRLERTKANSRRKS